MLAKDQQAIGIRGKDKNRGRKAENVKRDG